MNFFLLLLDNLHLYFCHSFSIATWSYSLYPKYCDISNSSFLNFLPDNIQSTLIYESFKRVPMKLEY